MVLELRAGVTNVTRRVAGRACRVSGNCGTDPTKPATSSTPSLTSGKLFPFRMLETCDKERKASNLPNESNSFRVHSHVRPFTDPVTG